MVESLMNNKCLSIAQVLTGPEAKNDCASEGRQQFTGPGSANYNSTDVQLPHQSTGAGAMGPRATYLRNQSHPITRM
jgi:hypothetical protein